MRGLITLNDNRFNYHYKGFTSIINQIIDIALHHKDKYGNLDVDIHQPQFDGIFSLTKKYGTYDYDPSVSFLNDFFIGATKHNIFNAHTDINLDNLIERKNVFDELFKFERGFYELVLKTKESLLIDENMLGLQLRGTDKNIEIPRIDDTTLLKNIDNIINKNNIDRIFLATDDVRYYDLIVSKYGEMVTINHGKTMSSDGTPLHFNGDRVRLNKEVLLDVLLLSNCGYLVYTLSNVGFLSSMFGVNKLKTITILKHED